MPFHHSGRGVFTGRLDQAGGGLTGYAGPEWQQGGGFNFGSFLWRHAKPLLGFLARAGLQTAAEKTAELSKDFLEGKNFKEATVSRLKEAVRDTGLKTIDKVRDRGINALDKAREKVAQVGLGRKRKSSRKQKKPTKRQKTVKTHKRGAKKPKRNKSSTNYRRRRTTLRKLNRIFL